MANNHIVKIVVKWYYRYYRGMTDELPNFVALMALHHTALVFVYFRKQCSKCDSEKYDEVKQSVAS